jgi:hypothetical protein
MTPIEFKGFTHRIAEDQEEYQTLPAYVDRNETISCWRLTLTERLRLLFGGHLWLRQMNQREPLQPQLPQVENPFSEA